MIAYKKHRRKVDPVKQILARLEERQNKTGLSLYSRSDHESSREDVLPMVHPLSDAKSASSKNSTFFPDLSTARQKAHRRLNAGSKHVMDQCEEKPVQFSHRTDRQFNLTFPPARPHKNRDNLGYCFSRWSESPSAGVENLRNNHHTTQSMNPFGYNRRTLAFQPTSLNYVVEWPETWPLKIMSLGKGTGRSLKKKPKTKLKDERKVHFKNSPVPVKEPINSSTYVEEGVSVPDQESSVLTRQPRPLPAVATRSPLHEYPEEKEPLYGQVLEVTSSNMMVPGRETHGCAEILRVCSETSSVSESAFVGNVTDKLATAPPCTPTPDPLEGEELDEEQQPDMKDGPEEEKKEEVEDTETEKEDVQDRLMGVVSQIAAEPSLDYKQDI